MAALYAIVGSDYRYVPKDRTAYLAYLRMRREATSLNVRQSQQVFFEWALRNDPLAFILLDPVVTVHPDQVFFEVFSKDEGAYAKLGIDLGAFELDHPPACGTTNIDFSPALYSGIEQMRSYRQTRLSIGKGRRSSWPRPRQPACWRSKHGCRIRGCAASSRCSRPRFCRATPSI